MSFNFFARILAIAIAYTVTAVLASWLVMYTIKLVVYIGGR